MTQSKQCLKCGHSAQYDTDQPISCPSCGAIYSKVEQSLREGPAPRPRPVARLTPTLSRSDEPDHHAFAAQLRQESLYPTFRTVVKIAYWLGVLAAVLVAIGGIVTSFSAGASALIGGIAIGALIFVFAKVGKEMSLMLADLSDATIRSAAKTEARGQEV